MPEPSNALFISELLGTHTHCTLSVHLHGDAKHTNDGALIDAYDYHEKASFALEIS